MYLTKIQLITLLEQYVIDILVAAEKNNDPNLEEMEKLFPVQYKKVKLKAFW